MLTPYVFLVICWFPFVPPPPPDGKRQWGIKVILTLYPDYYMSLKSDTQIALWPIMSSLYLLFWFLPPRALRPHGRWVTCLASPWNIGSRGDHIGARGGPSQKRKCWHWSSRSDPGTEWASLGSRNGSTATRGMSVDGDDTIPCGRRQPRILAHLALTLSSS